MWVCVLYTKQQALVLRIKDMSAGTNYQVIISSICIMNLIHLWLLLSTKKE